MSTGASRNNASESDLEALVQTAIAARRTIKKSKRAPGRADVEAALRGIAHGHSHPSNGREPDPVLNAAIETEKGIVLPWLAELVAIADQSREPKEQAGIYEYWRTYAKFTELRRDKLRELPLTEARQFMVRHCPGSPKPTLRD